MFGVTGMEIQFSFPYGLPIDALFSIQEVKSYSLQTQIRYTSTIFIVSRKVLVFCVPELFFYQAPSRFHAGK